MVSEEGLFDEGITAISLTPQELTVESRIEHLLGMAKSSAQIAAKVRADLDSVADNAKEGRLAAIENLVERVSQGVQQILESLPTLDSERRSLISTDDKVIRAYRSELVSALKQRGLTPAEGPYPYWLVYPAWFKVEQNSQGAIAVVLNGDVVDTVRPSRVADLIAQRVKDDFRAKDFAGLIRRVRDIIRHAGSPVGSMMLDDVFELMILQHGRKGVRKGDLTRADFYYMVHRLAELEVGESAQGMSFPPADRPGLQFFTRDGQPRKYLAVVFGEGGKS